MWVLRDIVLHFQAGWQMTATTKFAVALWILTFVASLQSQPKLEHGIILDSQDEGFHQMMLIGPEYLDPERLRSLYRESARDTDRVFKIDAVESRDDASHMNGKGATEQEFRDWERVYRAVSNRDSFRMTRLVAIGNDAVIETVVGSVASRKVVAGTDPLQFDAGGRKCRLLEIYWSRPLSPVGQTAGSRLNVMVDLRVDRLPEAAEAERITAELQRRMNYANLMAFMRTDTWFIDDVLFPLWFPFAPSEPAPTFQEYVSKGVVTCVGGDGTSRCRRSVR
jgi:hypothetical protein